MPAPPTRPLRLLLAVPLVALATACGGSEETNEREFIAESRAATLVRAVDRVEADLRSGDCEDALDGVDRLRTQVERLPDSYNARLVGNLTQWVDHLDAQVPQDCEEPEPEETPTPEETPEATPEPEETPEATPDPEETPAPEETTTPVPIPTPDGGDGGTGGSEPPDTGGVPPGDDGE